MQNTRTPRPRHASWFVTVLTATALVLAGLTVPVTAVAAAPVGADARVTAPTASARKFTVAPRPKITGTPAVGRTLRVRAGTWKPTARLTYQWYRGKTKIRGARGGTYKVSPADVGGRLSVKVAGRATGRTTLVRTSRSTSTVVKGRLTAPTPTIRGTAAVGATLTGHAGAWKPRASLAFQWLRGTTPVAGATGSAFTLTSADLGHKISLRVTGSHKGYVNASRTSKPSAAVATARFTTTSAPVITGSTRVGEMLTATTSAWSPAATFRYQWFRGTVAISGATGSTYRLTVADAGNAVRVRVTGTRAGVATASRDSVATPAITGTVSGTTPRITGSALVGSTLTGEAGTWGPAGVALTYQWKADGVAVPGATARTFTPGHADLRARITLTVTGRRAGHTSRALTSAAVVVGAPSTLGVNQSLPRGGELWSPTGSHRLVMQSDGNLVLHGPSGVLWASGPSSAARAVMQSDGNLVNVDADGTPRWNTGSWGGGGTRLVVQDDGNLVIYDANGKATWARNVVGFITVHAGSTAGGQPGTQSQSATTLSSTLFRVYPVGTRLPVVCGVTNGQAVSGSATGSAKSTVWHRLLWGDWVPDADFLTGVDGLVPRGRLGFAADEPNCGGGAETSTPLPGLNGWVFPIQPHATLTTYSGHAGDDFPVPNGTPVYAMSSGTVHIPPAYRVDARWCPVPAAVGRIQQDLLVTTGRDGKTYQFNYAHLSRFAVANGQTVKAGDLLGWSGDRGCVTGPHLHIDIKLDGVANRVFPRDLIGRSY